MHYGLTIQDLIQGGLFKQQLESKITPLWDNQCESMLKNELYVPQNFTKKGSLNLPIYMQEYLGFSLL